MATSEQLKSLIESHLEGDDPHFLAVAMQVAASEARLGHTKVAQEIRTLIDEAKGRGGMKPLSERAVPLAQPRGEIASLLSVSYPTLRLSDMILESDVYDRLTRMIKEHRQIAKIRAHGLSPRKKLLLIGPPGTGKTMSAGVLAGELGLPLLVVRLDSLITKFMGETAAKLRLIFDAIGQTRGVYLFDEFDSIGSQRGIGNDVGEIRRVLNSFLQLIEQDNSDSILLAATNHPDILDYALYRRFDDVVQYTLPGKEHVVKALKARLAVFRTSSMDWNELADVAMGLSYADITRACEEAVKDAIINDRRTIGTQDVSKNLSERKTITDKQV
jgi:SpoVK/Ycf46/Vps4 family AAA+-type ATPase